MSSNTQECKARVVIFTGNVVERYDLGRFVVDLSTIKTHKSRLSVDFDHDEQTPIGYIEDIEYVPGIGLVGVAAFSSPNDNDKAAEIVARIVDGFPFEVSPTLDLERGECRHLEAGEKATVNGQEVEGELDIYTHTPLRGVGVVLFGTDPDTHITKLKNSNLVTLSLGGTQMSKKCKTTKLEDSAVVEIPVIEEPAIEEAAKPDYLILLEKMIEAFGLEDGVEYFRQGLTFEEAEKVDYENLKQLRIQFSEVEEEEEEAAALTDTPADDEEEKEELRKELAGLKSELAKLRAIFSVRGESSPVSASVKSEPVPLDAVSRMAAKIMKTGIRKS